MRTWNGGSGSAWLTTGSWTPTGTFAGNAPNATVTGEGATTDIMTTSAANTATNVGINMGTLAGLLSLGGINLAKTDGTTLQIGNSSTSTNGILQLNGATINSVANTLIRVTGSANLTIANVNSGSGSQTMGLRLGITNGIFDTNTSRTLTISSIISEVSTNSGFTKSGAGNLTLSAANTYTGSTTISGGVLQTTLLANGGQPSGIGQSSSDAANLVIDNNAIFRYSGAAVSTDRSFTIGTSGGQIQASGTGAVTFTNTAPLALQGTDTPRTLTLNGPNVEANTLAASIGDNGTGATSLAKGAAGTWVLTGANTYTGATNVTGGTLALGNGGTSGSLNAASAIAVSAATTLRINRSDTMTQGTDFSTAPITGAGNFSQAGTGTTIFNAANDFTGTTTIGAGTLSIASTGSLNGASAITVAAGGQFNYNSATTLGNSLTLSGAGLGSRAVLSGTGTIGSAVTLDNLGDVLSPGNSPGILPFSTSQAWNSYSYDWEVNDWTGTTAGTAFDQIAITGGLNLTGSAYQLNLLSLTAGNTAGLVPNFAETGRSWTILTTTTGITGFQSSEWTVNAAGFSSSPSFIGSFSLATGNGGQDLVLTYAVPEPAAVGLIGAAGLLAAARIVRRMRVAG